MDLGTDFLLTHGIRYDIQDAVRDQRASLELIECGSKHPLLWTTRSGGARHWYSIVPRHINQTAMTIAKIVHHGIDRALFSTPLVSSAEEQHERDFDRPPNQSIEQDDDGDR